MWLTLQAPSSEFMSDKDLEELKADSNIDKGDAVRSKSNAAEQVAPQKFCLGCHGLPLQIGDKHCYLAASEHLTSRTTIVMSELSTHCILCKLHFLPASKFHMFRQQLCCHDCRHSLHQVCLCLPHSGQLASTPFPITPARNYSSGWIVPLQVCCLLFPSESSKECPECMFLVLATTCRLWQHCMPALS